MRLAPEVETTVHRVVQEALTNVRRHAHGADVAVRLEFDPRGHLRVETRNTAPTVRATAPTGGRGGFGLVGLRERVEAVEGGADQRPDSGRRLVRECRLPRPGGCGRITGMSGGSDRNAHGRGY
ncbi:ATP-binding protein [Streptomyces sp. TRM70350]|uniref:ATP-binding protein n=1 Tax=Streptomyces sp. TRM70350 TaxID=2856165 RepID=UPI002110053C|nr:ATP-binding protein [Streptomyces sp. TRM70350]